MKLLKHSMHVSNTHGPLPLIDLILLSVIKGQNHRSTLPLSITWGVLGTSTQAKRIHSFDAEQNFRPSQYDTADVKVLLKIFYCKLTIRVRGKRGTQLKKDSQKAMSTGFSKKSHSES